MNRRQKMVVRVAWILGLIAWIFRPSYVYWNSLSDKPELVWGSEYIVLDYPVCDNWIFKTRWDILLSEFAVIVLLTWVMMHLLEGEDERQRATKKSAWWMIKGDGKWVKRNRYILWFLVCWSAWLLIMFPPVEFAVLVLLTWFVMYKLLGEDVPGEAKREWAASKSALIVERGLKWVKNNRSMLWLLAGPSLLIAALVWRYL